MVYSVWFLDNPLVADACLEMRYMNLETGTGYRWFSQYCSARNIPICEIGMYA